MGEGESGLTSFFHLLHETSISPFGQKVPSVMEHASVCMELVPTMTQMSSG